MSLLSWLSLAPRKPTGGNSPQSAAGPRETRWLPVIDRDSCIGCERCVTVCPHACLEMEWSFSTLTNPQTCCGEAHCVEACPQQIIQMAWVPIEPPKADAA
jgi:formate hydrogenlyase subunit 6/NADH:ubiquinone oxidoreductase subunit I